MRPSLCSWFTLMCVSLVVATPCAAQFTAGGNYIGPALSLSSVGTSPVIEGHFERALNRNFGVGIGLGYWSYGDDAIGVDYSYFSAAVAGTYHFEVKSNPKWDPFVGAAIGYYFVSADIAGVPSTYDSDDSRPFLGVFGGTRYFVSPTIGLVGRLGLGATYLSLGVDFKL